jgi:CheY-like chemotaxis protein
MKDQATTLIIENDKKHHRLSVASPVTQRTPVPSADLISPCSNLIQAMPTSPAPVLLVEDDDNDVFLMRHAFTLARVQNPLFVAYSGEHAIELLQKASNHACLLVTDINLPGLDGLDLLVWLQTQPQFRDTTKLVISGSVFEEELTKSLALGAAGCFRKPHGITPLVELVRQWKEAYLDKAVAAQFVGNTARELVRDPLANFSSKVGCSS